MNPKQVYVIIVNYLNWQDTQECIQSLLASSYSNFSILVVDNNSGNDSIGLLKRSLDSKINIVETRSKDFGAKDIAGIGPGIVLIQNESNDGFAAANNIVIKELLNEDAYVWLLNPDMTVEPGTMEQLVLFAEKQQGRKITGSVIRSYAQKDKVLLYGGGQIRFNNGTARMITEAADEPQLDYISGASLFTHLSVFRDTGLLPEDYFLVWEETDWCYSAGQKGIGVVVCPSAVCYDKISTVLGKGLTAHYYYTRNGLYFISKYRHKNVRKALFYAILRFLRRVLTGQWQQARGVWKGVFDFRKNKKHAME